MITKDNLEIGKTYVGSWSKYRVIVKMNYKSLYSDNYYITSDNQFGIGKCLTGDGNDFREATELEKYWLDLCIEKGHIVPQPEFLKPNNNDYELY